MPGKKISDHQVLQYKKQRKTKSQSAAAATVGISDRSAQRIDAGRELPSQQPERHWRTRVDPFEEVWDADLVPLLQSNPHLSATTLFEELERRHPGEYAPGQVRTIQRRVRSWRARHGSERAVFFAQEHPPGRQGLSDFTVADALGITIAGAPFAHRLYQFALAHSGCSIALTTNLPFEKWTQVFPDEMAATAVIDRLVHHGSVFAFAGESHRLRTRGKSSKSA